MWKWEYYNFLFFITEEQTELHVVRDISGITKRQDVSVGIRYATVLSNIPHYKSIAYIYLHLFPIHFQVFFFCLISACVKGFTGHNCNVICPFPAYGLDCQSICNCTEKSCDPGDGCIGHTTENGIVRNKLFPPILQCILKSLLDNLRYEDIFHEVWFCLNFIFNIYKMIIISSAKILATYIIFTLHIFFLSEWQLH